ncbi:hypothetical protein HGB47_16875 [Leptospira yasudae]|uniref:phage tail protein n=1 Tax=Leptospira yasudae TaxID=2202201 RepID=UPI001C4E337A|nr:hypothetical protein [Leptospira yasudae]MBW0435286.1 hypothetical protein [Leptospira yasudae]
MKRRARLCAGKRRKSRRDTPNLLNLDGIVDQHQGAAAIAGAGIREERDFLDDAMDWAGDKVDGEIDSVVGAASSAWNGIKNVASAAWDGVKDAASATWNGVKGAASAVWNGAVNGITAVGNAASNAWNGAKNAVFGPDKVVMMPALGGKSNTSDQTENPIKKTREVGNLPDSSSEEDAHQLYSETYESNPDKTQISDLQPMTASYNKLKEISEKVKIEMNRAWKESNPYGIKSERRENGFYIYENNKSGKIITKGFPKSGQIDSNNMTIPVLVSKLKGYTAVAWFHTHPNPERDGDPPTASDADQRATSKHIKLPGIIMSHSGLFFIEP